DTPTASGPCCSAARDADRTASDSVGCGRAARPDQGRESTRTRTEAREGSADGDHHQSGRGRERGERGRRAGRGFRGRPMIGRIASWSLMGLMAGAVASIVVGCVWAFAGTASNDRQPVADAASPTITATIQPQVGAIPQTGLAGSESGSQSPGSISQGTNAATPGTESELL